MLAASPTSRVPDIPGSQAQPGPYVRAGHTDWLQPPFGRRLMASDVGDPDIPHRATPSIAIDPTKGRVRRASSSPRATLMGHPASCQGMHADLEEIAP